MNCSRLLLLIVAGCCFFRPETLLADDAAPFTMPKSYSSDMVMTTKGMTMTDKIFSDDGKIRTEVSMAGMQMISIIRPDEQKMYSVMPAQKMVMEAPFDLEKMKKDMATATGPEGKYEVVGPETVDGIACTKYKVTTPDGKVYDFWIDAAAKTPVKMAAQDGSLTVSWKNFTVGPQDAALFEPPSDYQKMAMPAMPNLPNMSAPAGQ